MEYMILDDYGNLISRENFAIVIPDITQSTFRTSKTMIDKAIMKREDVLKWKEVKQQYGWNYRVFEFKEGKLCNMEILAKFE